MVNIFAGGPKINEKLGESVEQPTNPLKNLNGEKIKFDGGNLYGEFKKFEKQIPDSGDQNKLSDTKDGKSEIFKENSKYSPIIDRLFETDQISEETRNILLSEDLSKNKIDFDSIEGIDPKEKEILKGTFYNLESSENNREQNLIELKNDSKAFEKIPGLSGFDFSLENDNFKSEVLNSIGKNYLKFPDKNNEFNEARDLSVAIITTKIQIIENVQNIPDSTTYDVAIKNIESGDLKKQLEGIESLYMLAYSNEGKLGKTTLDKYKNKRKKELITEFQKLNKEFDALELQQTINEINKRKKEINERITEIGNEANEIEAGDIFPANDDEKVNSNIEQISSK